MDMKINHTMPRVSAIIVIINLEETKNLGNVVIQNFMQLVFVRIVILITIIRRKDRGKIDLI